MSDKTIDAMRVLLNVVESNSDRAEIRHETELARRDAKIADLEAQERALEDCKDQAIRVLQRALDTINDESNTFTLDNMRRYVSGHLADAIYCLDEDEKNAEEGLAALFG